MSSPTFDPSKTFSVYGLGSVGQQLVSALKKQGYEIPCIIDQRSVPGQTIEGIPCITPEQCENFAVKQVLLGVFNREVSPNQLAERIIPYGVEVIIPYPQIAEHLEAVAAPLFWYDASLSIDAYSQELALTRRLFSDDLSRNTFDQLVAFRKTPRLETHVEGIGLSSQYFAPPIPGWLKNESITFVDCGAFTGDTLAAALTHNIPLHTAYCFEPDVDNFQQLQQWTKQHPTIDWHCFPFATWSASTPLYFSMLGQESSCVATTSSIQVNAVALDEVLAQTPFNMIKLDVEGAEMQTLEGAINCLINYRPHIAVSVYHRPQDLWEIPLFLHKHLTHYRYYLIQHGHHGIETVLYALPNH